MSIFKGTLKVFVITTVAIAWILATVGFMAHGAERIAAGDWTGVIFVIAAIFLTSAAVTAAHNF